MVGEQLELGLNFLLCVVGVSGECMVLLCWLEVCIVEVDGNDVWFVIDEGCF